MSSIQNTKITWVNHASFIISNENINLISDPWIEGRVFNQSWDLLVPTVFTYNDFKEKRKENYKLQKERQRAFEKKKKAEEKGKKFSAD